MTIGIVNYNRQNLLKNYLDSIYNQVKGLNFEIIVSDNNSQDDTLKMLSQEFSGVKIIANETNRGFSYAINKIIQLASSEFIFICNQDLQLVENIFPALLDYMKNNPRVAMLGPKIVDAAGNLEISFNKHCRNLIRCFLDNIFFYSHLRVKVFEKYLIKFFPYFLNHYLKGPVGVAWLSGAAFLVRKTAMKEVGLMDEKFFLYCEDEDIGCRMNKCGWQVYYFPGSAIVHLRGKSIGGEEINYVRESTKSQIHYYCKRYPKFIIILVKFLIAWRLSVETLLLGAFYILSIKDKAILAKRIKYYFQAIKAIAEI